MTDMECGCSCDLDYEPIMPFNERFPTARKQHKCCECGGVISPSERYQYVWGMCMGESVTYKTCITCYRIRCDYGCAFTNLAEDVWECLGVEL